MDLGSEHPSIVLDVGMRVRVVIIHIRGLSTRVGR